MKTSKQTGNSLRLITTKKNNNLKAISSSHRRNGTTIWILWASFHFVEHFSYLLLISLFLCWIKDISVGDDIFHQTNDDDYSLFALLWFRLSCFFKIELSRNSIGCRQNECLFQWCHVFPIEKQNKTNRIYWNNNKKTNS